MEDKLVLVGGGQLLAPIIYDIHLSTKDFQELQPSFAQVRSEWQQHLIRFAAQRPRPYILNNPIITLKEDPTLRPRDIKIITDLSGIVSAILSELEHAMEANLDNSKGRQTAPITYEIYLSITDHQQLLPNFNIIKNDWAEHLVQFARKQQYVLSDEPILILHATSKLSLGSVEVIARMANPAGQAINQTTAINPKELEKLRQPATSGGNSSPHLPHLPNPPGIVNAPLPPARLTIRQSAAAQQVYQIQKSTIDIGRQLDNDIIVEDSRVSRHHAKIVYQSDGEFHIFKISTTNNITINGVPIQGQYILRNGDHFTIGNYDFYFERK